MGAVARPVNGKLTMREKGSMPVTWPARPTNPAASAPLLSRRPRTSPSSRTNSASAGSPSCINVSPGASRSSSPFEASHCNWSSRRSAKISIRLRAASKDSCSGGRGEITIRYSSIDGRTGWRPIPRPRRMRPVSPSHIERRPRRRHRECWFRANLDHVRASSPWAVCRT